MPHTEYNDTQNPTFNFDAELSDSANSTNTMGSIESTDNVNYDTVNFDNKGANRDILQNTVYGTAEYTYTNSIYGDIPVNKYDKGKKNEK